MVTKDNENPIEFFNYTKVPIDKYIACIYNSIQYINKYLQHTDKHNLLSRILNTDNIELVMENARNYNIKESEKLNFFAVISLLFNCLHANKANLQYICRVYRIDLGHLYYSEDNNVYEKIHNLTKMLITQALQTPKD